MPTRSGTIVTAWWEKHGTASDPVSLRDMLAWAMSMSVELVAEDEKENALLGRHASCRKGCGSCCRQPVPLSPAEALHLADLLGNLPDTRNAEVTGRFASVRERLAANGLGEAALLSQAEAYFELKIPCPFLEEESCSIHLERPLVCREYLVESPPFFCDTLNHPMVEWLPMSLSVRDALGTATAKLMNSAAEWIPLVRVPEWVEANAGLGELRWPSSVAAKALMDALDPTGNIRRSLETPPPTRN